MSKQFELSAICLIKFIWCTNNSWEGISPSTCLGGMSIFLNSLVILIDSKSYGAGVGISKIIWKFVQKGGEYVKGNVIGIGSIVVSDFDLNHKLWKNVAYEVTNI